MIAVCVSLGVGVVLGVLFVIGCKLAISKEGKIERPDWAEWEEWRRSKDEQFNKK